MEILAFRGLALEIYCSSIEQMLVGVEVVLVQMYFSEKRRFLKKFCFV